MKCIGEKMDWERTGVQDPGAGHPCAWPYFAISRDDALVVQVAEDAGAFIVPCEGGDEQGLDGGELGKKREQVGRGAAPDARDGVGACNGRWGGVGWEREGVGQEERTGGDDAKGSLYVGGELGVVRVAAQTSHGCARQRNELGDRGGRRAGRRGKKIRGQRLLLD